MNQTDQPTLIFDFDSTFITGETLDILAVIALMNHPERGKRIQEICKITNEGMNGTIPFEKSLRSRFELLDLKRKHVEEATDLIRQMFISPSIRSFARELRAYAHNTYIASGGFKDIITPIVAAFDIPKDHVIGNTLCYDGDLCIGVDPEQHMAKTGGKIAAITELKKAKNLSSPLIAIGDGYTDWQLFESGTVDEFYAYTETAVRENVVALAGENRVATSFHPIAERLGWRHPIAPEGQPLCLSTEMYPMPMQARK